MSNAPPGGRYGPDYTPKMVAAIASCSAAIARLDARISVSPTALAWSRRATWSGYTRALQLQGAEIDEIDVFSWGCEHQIPGRPLRATNLDLFDRFEAWRDALLEKDLFAWRDALPTAIGEPLAAAEHPTLVRALDNVRQHAQVDGGMAPWLALPFALRDIKLSASPLPCLVGGVKAFRLKKVPMEADWLQAIRAIEASASGSLERLHALERIYRDARRAILAEYRPGALPALLALSCHQPLLSPQSVSEVLGMSVAGASKLLERAAETGLLIEITRRRTWRVFLAADLAIDFGYATPKRGRPRSEPSPLPADRALSDVFDAFDREMSGIDELLRRSAGQA